MPISFNDIPANWRQPLYWVEVDGSKAGLPVSHMRTLIVGTMITEGVDPDVAVPGDLVVNGVAEPNIPLPIGRLMDAERQFGEGSELALMFRSHFNNNFANEVWALPVPEPDMGTAASGTITIASPPIEAGTLHLYIGGHNIRVNIRSGTPVNTIATNIAREINNRRFLPVTAVAAAAVVTLTCKWFGVNGNDITMMDSYFGKIGGQEVPVGMEIVYSGLTLTGGVGVPEFEDGIAAMGETEFEFVALPYTDSQSLYDWEQEFGFGDDGRWGWMRQLYGHIFSARRGTYANQVLWGLTRNGRVTSVLAVEPTSPTPIFEWTAAYTAKAARALINDPARPLQTLSLTRILSAPFHDRWNLLELQTFSMSGLATQRTWVGNTPAIARESTTYQLNYYGHGDDAFELVTTLATLAKLIRNQRHAITSSFPRHKLANDDTRFGPGQAIVTPKIIKAHLVAQYSMDMWNGLVEDMRAFKDHLIVERDPNDPNRANVLYPPDLINQLRIFAVLAQFRLQNNRGIDTATPFSSYSLEN